jgi:site-specific recombinase XerD
MQTDRIRTTTAATSFTDTLAAFVASLAAANCSAATIAAYQADVGHCLAFLQNADMTVAHPDQILRGDLLAYLASLSARGLSGVSRARKLAAIRGYFRFLVAEGLLDTSPAAAITTPKQERGGKTFLAPEEYNRLLSYAGTDPRDYAIFQVFLQTGLRVSELCALRCSDIDLSARMLTVRSGKGMTSRTIELEQKSAKALKTYLDHRPESFDDHLFLNRYGQPISERGVRKMVAKYLKAGDIRKKASCHSLRHTFATQKAEHGVSPYQLQLWLGHRDLRTTQIYVHLGRRNARKAMEATSL